MMRITMISPLILFALAACGKDPGGVQPRVAVLLSVISGDAQTDTVTQLLDQPITARASDSVTAKAVPGVVLNWFRVIGSDSTFLGAGATNDSGVGRLRPTLATRAGPQGIVAWALDDAGNRTVYAEAHATALPANVATFVVPTPDTVRAPAFPDTTWLEYRYQDTYGNASWSCSAGAPDQVTWDTFDGAYALPIAAVRIDSAGRHFQGIEVRGSHDALRVIATASCAAKPDTVYLPIRYTGP